MQKRIMPRSVTAHARRRMAQRAIHGKTVEMALRYGRKVYSGGAIYWILGRREVVKMRQQLSGPGDRRGWSVLDRYANTVVVCSHDGAVLTVWRNRHLRVRHKFARHRFRHRGRSRIR